MENEAAVAACRKALELDPGLAFGEGLLGLLHAHRGHYDEAMEHAGNAVRLSPRDSTNRWWILARVIAALVAERYEDYMDSAKEMTEVARGLVVGWRHLVAAYANLDRLDEAKAALGQLLRLSPEDGLEMIRRSTPVVHPKARESYLDGLRKAGMPD